jgi:polysaccharide pyruvyl transferase WcaK-like protein
VDLNAKKSGRSHPKAGSRIALLTPYSGGNLGDAAIQDAIIANLRLYIPEAQFSGISLNCENFLERHGRDAFPLCGTNVRFYAMSHGSVSDHTIHKQEYAGSRSPTTNRLKDVLKRTPLLFQLLKNLRRWVLLIPQELLHMARGYRFLRRQDILIVSGGGQLDEGWGGPWGHPFALFKWVLLARMARVPSAFVSVGACKVKSTLCRLFLSLALRLVSYRSYRDEESKRIATTLLKAVVNDPVVPDLAFGLPVSEMQVDADIQRLSRGRTVVAISPIAYAKPGVWPFQDHVLYSRYLQQMATLLSQLVKRDYFLVMVWSSLGDDDNVIPEILGRLDDVSGEKLSEWVYVPRISTWQDFTSVLRGADFLIASRLHSIILGLVNQRPTIAISFHPKVDRQMECLNQTDYLLQIRNFLAQDVIAALDRLKLRKESILGQMSSSRRQILRDLDLQYDTLVQLAMAGHHNRIEAKQQNFAVDLSAGLH